MESPTASTVTSPSTVGEMTKLMASRRTAVIESIRGCTLSGLRIDKEELKKRLMMPKYIRDTMRDAIKYKDFNLTTSAESPMPSPEGPVVVFINSKSGGRHGPELKDRLRQLMSEEQVFDLSDVTPTDFVKFGLGSLEKLASMGDSCAKDTREKLRIMVAGGDGTVGWVLSSLGELHTEGREPIPPVGIVPLGTGNDLARSFFWGGSFPLVWKLAIKKALQRAITGPVSRLDSWNILVSIPIGEIVDPPHSLKPTEECSFDKGLVFQEPLPKKVKYYEGVFYNYFSIGMDAQIAYGFHHLRNEKPYLAQGPISNKLIYSGYTCKQGWFLTPCISDPSLRGLKHMLKIFLMKVNCSEWEEIPIPKSVRAVVALNLPSYGSGRNPWGSPKPDYLERRGFVEAQVDDGLIEIFGLKQGWHASLVMVELISAKHLAQATTIRMEIKGGECKDAYMQMDGEPWKQPISKKYASYVEIKRVPYQSIMIYGE